MPADPREGLAPDGTIRTGASRHRIPPHFVAMVDTAVDRIAVRDAGAAVYVYGSVATGAARPPASDLDLLTIGLDPEGAAAIAADLSAEFDDRCRGVEIAAAMASDFDGDGDAAYGSRVFLHHYCVHLAGPDLDRTTTGFPGDRRAARGFNGDIARHARQWRRQLDQIDAATLGRRAGRKTLLAVAGLVSIHDSTWTTDRVDAVHRWAQVHPDLAAGLDSLLGWASDSQVADELTLARQLDTVIDRIVQQFAADIGLWPDATG